MCTICVLHCVHICPLMLLLDGNIFADDTLKPDIVTSTTDAYHSIMKQANSDSGFNILVPYDNVVQVRMHIT